MNNSKDFMLYLVSDSRFESSKSMYDQIEEAIKNGVSMIQFRDKYLNDNDFLQMAIKLRELTSRYNVPLVINDRVDIAIKCSADGVHIGRDDMDIKKARKLLGQSVFIGSSVATVEEALKVQEEGADYVGVGAMYNTTTKDNTKSVSLETLKEICDSIDIPAVAIGGINEENIANLSGRGISGVALVSAILGQSDIAKSTSKLKVMCEDLFA